jgi:hypothetical protein
MPPDYIGVEHPESYMRDLMDIMHDQKIWDFTCNNCEPAEHNCFEDGEANWTPAYKRHRERNKKLPVITKEDLTLPTNSKLLWYGHSYTRQIVDNVVAANKVQ